jgi:hypothetical protein
MILPQFNAKTALEPDYDSHSIDRLKDRSAGPPLSRQKAVTEGLSRQVEGGKLAFDFICPVLDPNRLLIPAAVQSFNSERESLPFLRP